MSPTDKTAFTAILAKTWRFYDKPLAAEVVADWFDLLKDCSLDAVATAFNRHLTDSAAGRFLPKPADIIGHLPTTQEPDDHPGAEEAWGMVIRFVNDERETGLLTEPMRAAWETCGPILDMGDEVGARMCFLETYRKALKIARNAGQRAQWSVTLGTDVERRKTALQAAVDARRISLDYAQSLLPAPAANLEAVAGLLECDRLPEPGQPSISDRLRGLAAALRQSQAEDADRAMQAEQQRRAAIEARKPAAEPEADDHFREVA